MGRLERKMQRSVQAKGVVHELVAETAKEFALAIYEEMASSDNAFYRMWPKPEKFVKAKWQSFIQPAREHLAELLGPAYEKSLTEDMKRRIHEALLLNAAANPALNHLN